MNSFDFEDKIKFTKAVFYNFRPIPLPKPFQDGTGGFGQFIPEQGYLELSDDTGMTAHYTVTRAFVRDMLPQILNGETKSYNEWRESLYWKSRNAGFQSAAAVNVGTVDLLMLDILAQRAGKPIHRFLGAEKDWAAAYKGGGSLLLSDEELVEDMCRYVSEGFTTVKFKIGSDKGQNMERDLRRIEKVRAAVGDEIGVAVDANQRWTVEEAVKFAKMAEQAGVSAVTVHGRTRAQLYSGAADWDVIRRVKEAVKIPVFGNGDIFTPEDAKRMMDETGCDGVAIARGAQGNPWLIRRTVEYLRTGELLPAPSIEEVIAMIHHHTELMLQYKGEFTTVREMRKHIAWYTEGYPDSAKLRGKVNTAGSIEELYALVDSMKR